MPTARLLAQAKINLFLRVLAREATGYHQIETLFCRLALGDVVTVRAGGNERSLDCTGERLPDGGLGQPAENLAWRAAVAYSQLADWPSGFAIEIEKRIPVGGGLGGGSADAGAVLRALNAVNPHPLPTGVLLTLAASLGADVPFLTQGAATLALGWGRGERLLALPSLEQRPCILFTQDFPVSTREAYGWLAQETITHQAGLVDPYLLTQWDGVAAVAHNDFEDVVAARYPGIASALAGLRSPGARDLIGERSLVQLSGSGATIFAIVEPDEWNRLTWRSDEPGLSVITTRTADHVEPVEIAD